MITATHIEVKTSVMDIETIDNPIKNGYTYFGYGHRVLDETEKALFIEFISNTDIKTGECHFKKKIVQKAWLPKKAIKRLEFTIFPDKELKENFEPIILQKIFIAPWFKKEFIRCEG